MTTTAAAGGHPRTIFLFFSAIIISCISLALLPSGTLTLSYQPLILFRAWAGIFVLFFYFVTLWFVINRALNGWAAIFGFVVGAVLTLMLMGITNRADWLLIVGAVAGIALLFRGLKTEALPTQTEILLTGVALSAALLLLKLDTGGVASGAYVIQWPDRAPAQLDWLYHRTLIASILRTGVAATGVSGIIADNYHVGAHYFLAGVLRTVGATVDTSPAGVSTSTINVLAITILMLFANQFMKRTGIAAPAIGMLAAACSWLLVTWTFEMGARDLMTHTYVMTSGIALSLGGMLFLFSLVTVTGDTEEKTAWPTFAAISGLFAIVCMTKISNGLLVYSAVGLAFAIQFLRAPRDRMRLVQVIAWAIVGGLILGLAYEHVATISNVDSPDRSLGGYFNDAHASRAIMPSVVMTFMSLTAWLVLTYLRGKLDERTSASLTGLHLVGLCACFVVSVSGVVSHHSDIAYFWISARQMALFSLTFAVGMIGVICLASLSPMSAALKGALSAACVIGIAAGSYRVYDTAFRHWKISTDYICRTIGEGKCKKLGPASAYRIIETLSAKSQVAKIVTGVRKQKLTADNAVILIDKRSGFFRMRSPDVNWARRDGCYTRGWSVYALSGVPILSGIAHGAPSEGLCRGKNPDDEFYWYRYGYGVYDLEKDRAREYSLAEIQANCGQPDFKNRQVVYVDQHSDLNFIDCRKTAATNAASR